MRYAWSFRRSQHLLAMFGAYALICAEVRALLVICT